MNETGTRDPGVMVLAVAGGILLALVIALAGWYVVTSDDDLQCSTENVERTQDGLPPLRCD